jgi:hypothetical protein
MIYLFFIRFRRFLFRFLNREVLLNNYLIIIYITFFLYTYIVVKRHNKISILIKNSPHKLEVIIIILLMILIYLHKKLYLCFLPLHILQSSRKHSIFVLIGCGIKLTCYSATIDQNEFVIFIFGTECVPNSV